MEELEIISKLTTKIDPTGFDLTVSSFLIGIGAERYAGLFRKHNIGQCTLSELSDEDLIQLGVTEESIRTKILEEVKNLPLNDELDKNMKFGELGLTEIADILEDSSQHSYRIYLSILVNTLAVKKTKNIPDCLLYREKYASDIAISTLSEINRIVNSMDVALQTQLKVHLKKSNSKNTKKIIVGVIGSTTIVVLSILFIRSLRNLR